MSGPNLRVIRVLADMSPAQLEQLSGCGVVQQFSPGQKIIDQGTVAPAMYFLLEGKTGAYAVDPHGNEVHLRTMETGSHFGELGLLTGRRTATVKALEPTTVFCLDAAAFEGILNDLPEMAVRLLYGLSRSLAIRLADVTSRYTEARSFKDVWSG